jgi:hypothetical protein
VGALAILIGLMARYCSEGIRGHRIPEALAALLFEWKPRSLIPVAVASVTASIARWFQVPVHPAWMSPAALAGCVLAGSSSRSSGR